MGDYIDSQVLGRIIVACVVALAFYQLHVLQRVERSSVRRYKNREAPKATHALPFERAQLVSPARSPRTARAPVRRVRPKKYRNHGPVDIRERRERDAWLKRVDPDQVA